MSFAPVVAMPISVDADSAGQLGAEPRNDFLNQYLKFEDTTDSEDHVFLATSGSTLLVKSVNESKPASSSPNLKEDGMARHNNLYVFSRGEPGVGQNTAFSRHTSRGGICHLENLGAASNCELDLLSLNKITLQSPVISSPPSPPNLSVVKASRGRRRLFQRTSRTSRTFSKESESSDLRHSSPTRQATRPTSMMHASHYNEQNVHDWGQRLALDAQKFDFEFQTPADPLSPPPSGRVSDSSETCNNMMATIQQHDGNFSWDHPIQQQYTCRGQTDLNSPLTTPPADISTFHQSNVHHASANNNMVYTSHRNQPSTTWAQNPLTTQYSFDSSSYISEDEPASLWWGQTTVASMAQPSPIDGFSRQSTKSLAMGLQAELAFNANEFALGQSSIPSGLMIHVPHSPGQQSFNVEPSPINQQGYFAPVAAALQPLQPQEPHHYAQTQPQVQLPQNFAPSKNKREKSLPQIESSSSPSPRSRSASFHVTKHRGSRSVSRRRDQTSSHTTKTPKAGAGATGMTDFVNYTPNDSRKILTGVAPSGSSKTKARREKEAMEKTRRLSQAAVRAVQAAGGNIESLFEEGLVPPPH